MRTVSGALYISIIIFALFASREWFFVLFLALGFITISEFLKLVRLKSYLGYLLLIAFLFFLSYKVIDQNAVYLYCIIALFVNLFLMKDLLVVSKIPMFEKKKYIVLICYLIAGFVFLTLIPMRNDVFVPELIVGAFAIVWSNDSFAYLVGKNFGKRKLLERISPKKTVEGFVGGLVGGLIASFLIFKYTELLDLKSWIIIAILITFTGTIGDLIQSKFKRQAGVKDSGVIMPGHGGIYDRLDSVLYASPFVFGFLEVMDYVS